MGHIGDDAIERLRGRGLVKHANGSTIVGPRPYTIEVYEDDESIESHTLGGGFGIAPSTYRRIELEIEWASELEKAQLFGQELVLQLQPPDSRRVPFTVRGDGEVFVLGGFQDAVEGGA